MATKPKSKKYSEADIEQFVAITGASKDIAENLLEACNGNLELAIDMQMDGGGGEHAACGGASAVASTSGSAVPAEEEDDVRAPIPQKNETLVEDVPTFVTPVPSLTDMDDILGFRGRRRQARSVFDGFRDFQAEARQQEEMLMSGTVSAKRRTLEDLFRPPIDITFKGTLANAREIGMTQKKWLMVNIQNVQEFVCQALNRDLWSHSSVKAIIKEHFIFWQVYHDSEEGSKFCQFYKIDKWPYIAILDPRTGENMIAWSKLDPAVFNELVTEFISDNAFSDGSTGTSPPPSKRLKREPSIVDANEDDQLQAAIRASLQQDKPIRTSVIIDSDSNIESDDLETFTDSEDNSYPPSPVKSKKSVKSDKKIVNNLCTENNSEQTKQTCVQDEDKSETDISPSCSGENSQIGNTENSQNSNANSSESQSTSDRSYKNYLGTEEDPQTSLMIRFPDGNRQQLSISCRSKLMALVLFVAEHGFSNERFELVTNFPRRKLSYMDFDITIEEAGLHPQETVFVQAR